MTSVYSFAKYQAIKPVITMGEMAACGQYGPNMVVHKMGYNPSISGTTVEDVWTQGGNYAFPTAAAYPAEMEIASDSADDDGTDASGTGAQSVTIGYLTTAGVQKSETVLTNGTAAVATTATDIWRINSFRVETAGTGLAAAGKIQLREIDNAPVFSAITTGQTRARNMVYTVPAGYGLYINDIQIASSAATVDKAQARFTLRGNVNNGVITTVGLEYPLWECAVNGGAYSTQLKTPIYVPAGVDLRMKVVGVTTTDAAQVFCEWRGCLISA